MVKSTLYSISPKIIYIALLALLGCAPVISKQVREQVNQSITLEEVCKNPERYRGEVIIVSGDIIETENTKEGTFIKVLQHPPDFRGKPKNTDASVGRFLAFAGYYLDPFIYAKGRNVTIAGEVQGKQTLPLDEIEYSYPLIHIKEIYLWPIVRTYYFPRRYYYNNYWWWRSRYW